MRFKLSWLKLVEIHANLRFAELGILVNERVTFKEYTAEKTTEMKEKYNFNIVFKIGQADLLSNDIRYTRILENRYPVNKLFISIHYKCTINVTNKICMVQINEIIFVIGDV